MFNERYFNFYKKIMNSKYGSEVFSFAKQVNNQKNLQN